MRLENVSLLNFLDGQAMTLIPLASLKAEVSGLLAQCGDVPSTPIDAEDDDWEKVMLDLLSVLPPQTEKARRSNQQVLPLSESYRQMIALQCRRLLQSIQDARKAKGQDFDATPWCLLPANYPARVQSALGYAQLPLAWVMVMDVLQARLPKVP